jgi:2-iminoacetate synthase ThiH
MGNTTLTPEELEAMLDRAARRGSRETLHALGLHDETAAKDIQEIRNLLASWRDTKRSIWSAAVRWGTVALLTFIATAVYMQLGNK